MALRKTSVLMLMILFLGASVAVVGSQAAEVKAWRVEGKLIRVGDSKARVAALAGEPDSKENLRKAIDTGDEKKGEKVDVWHYRIPDKEKIYIIHFRDSKVSKIQWQRY